jgi:hypothetical protein
MPNLTPTLALALLVQTAAAQTPDDAVRSYMHCVRRNAEILEPSGDPPQDVARAAVFLCGREETAALNAGYRPNASPRSTLRDTALFYGAAQATVARACRIAQRCGLAPLPNSN